VAACDDGCISLGRLEIEITALLLMKDFAHTTRPAIEANLVLIDEPLRDDLSLADVKEILQGPSLVVEGSLVRPSREIRGLPPSGDKVSQSVNGAQRPTLSR